MVQNKEYKSGIDWIDTHAALHAVCTTFDIKEVDLDDHLVFEEIEGEMMKRGTLTHNTIRWDFVLEQSLLLLRQEAKDFRLILFIIHSLPHLPPTPSLPAPLPLACHLLAAFLHHWETVASPQGRARKHILARLVDALDILVKKAEENGVEAHYLSSLQQALQQSSEVLSSEASDVAEKLRSLRRRIENSVADVPSTAPEQMTAGSRQQQTHDNTARGMADAATTATNANAPRPSDLVLDSSNERALRESLAKMADFLFDLDHNQPLSYRLRRYACWYGMREQPALKKDAATIIMPPAEESVDLYRQVVTQEQTAADIVKRLERSCYLQPFWIEGQYLAWQLARGRGAMPVANAILEETSQFVKTAPWLAKLQFSSQTAFIPDEVKKWLTSHKNSSLSTSGTTQAEAESSPIKQARELAKAGDLVGACALLDRRTDAFDDLRSRTLWEISVLELLNEWGIKTHAALTAARLEETVAALTVSEWEGNLLERLRQLKSAVI